MQDFMNSDDPDQQEMFKNMAALNHMIQGSDFERQLDSFLEAQIASGVDPEDILKSALQNYKREEDPFKNGEQVEFDPSQIVIDQKMMESFSSMMDQR